MNVGQIVYNIESETFGRVISVDTVYEPNICIVRELFVTDDIVNAVEAEKLIDLRNSIVSFVGPIAR